MLLKYRAPNNPAANKNNTASIAFIPIFEEVEGAGAGGSTDYAGASSGFGGSAAGVCYGLLSGVYILPARGSSTGASSLGFSSSLGASSSFFAYSLG